MNNCLVTKLKGEVSNNELPKLGELVARVNSSFSVSPKSSAITVRASKNALSLTENGSPSSSVEVTDLVNATTIYVSQECTVFIPQYNLSVLNIDPIDDIDIEFASANFHRLWLGSKNLNSVHFGVCSPYVNSIQLENNTIDFSASGYSLLSSVKFATTNLKQKMDVDDFTSKAPLLSDYRCFGRQQTGTFDNFGRCKDILRIYGFTGNGSIEGFVTAQRQAYGGRAAKTTGTVNLLWCSKVTFQGVDGLIKGTEKILSWTANTITFDGTTINA